MGWCTDIYLQANQSSVAVNFYNKVGFKRMKANDVNVLPISWQQIVNKDELGDFYLRFINNKTNEIEAETRVHSSGTEVTYEESIHLFQLCGKINAIHYDLCYNSET